MAYFRKLLSSSAMTSNATPSTPPEAMSLETDFVVVVAALLCAVISVLGLIVMARCACLRRGAGSWSFGFGGGNQLMMPNKGLKKKVLNSFPKYTHNSSTTATAEVEVVVAEECAICLSDFGDGDVIRVLPQCGHKFHVQCIDTWLASHSSCPSCRQILALVTRCQKCGEFPRVPVN